MINDQDLALHWKKYISPHSLRDKENLVYSVYFIFIKLPS